MGGYKMTDAKEIIGNIIDKSMKELSSEQGEYLKYSFKIRKDDGRDMTLGFFAKEKEQETLAKKILLNMRIKFVYSDSQKGDFIYHNIQTMEEVKGDAPAIPPKSIEISTSGYQSFSDFDRQKLIVKQSSLSNALKFFEIRSETKDYFPDDILQLAEKFNDWVWDQKKTKQLTTKEIFGYCDVI